MGTNLTSAPLKLAQNWLVGVSGNSDNQICASLNDAGVRFRSVALPWPPPTGFRETHLKSPNYQKVLKMAKMPFLAIFVPPKSTCYSRSSVRTRKGGKHAGGTCPYMHVCRYLGTLELSGALSRKQDIGQNWPKLTKISQNWSNLYIIGPTWPKKKKDIPICQKGCLYTIER